MTDRTVRVVLSATIGQFQAAMQAAAGNVQELNRKMLATANAAKDWERQNQTAAQKTAQHMRDMSAAYDKTATGLVRFGGVLTAAVGGGFAAAVKGFADFDRAMSQVSASTGASAEDLAKMRQAAMDAGQAFGQFTSTDAAGALEELGKAGLSANDSIKALNGVMGLAAADNMEVGRAAEITAQALTIFSRQGVTATQVADNLAQAAGAAVGSAQELGEGLGNVGPLAAQMGMSLEDTVNTLAVFAQNGIRGAEGGTQLKSMLMKLQNPTAGARKEMDKLGLVAYDTNGKFVGMRSIFEQLSEKTKSLTDEQKAQTLATIFQSYAVQGASIATKEGAAGYDSMSEAMKRFGSAEDIAKKRTDNLYGDFKELQGAFENLGISAGAAANGPLRDLIQRLTSVVEWAGKHPQVVQAAGLIVGALGGFALAAGGVMKAVTAFNQFKNAMNALGITSRLAQWKGSFRNFFSEIKKGTDQGKKNLASLGKAAGGAVLFAGLTAAAKGFAGGVEATYDKMRVKTNDAMAAMKLGNEDWISSLQFSEGVVLKTTYDISDTIKRALDPALIDSFADGMNGLFGTTAPEEIKKSFAEIDKALASVDFDMASANFKKLYDQIDHAKVSNDQLLQLFPQFKASLEEQATQLGVTSLSLDDYANWMAGKVPPAVQAAADAASAAGKDMTGLGDAMSDSAKDAQDQAAALDQLNKSLNEAANKALALSGSQMGLEAAYDDAAASIAENGKTLDITTEKGRNNRQALDNIAQSALSLTKAMLDDGRSMEEVNAKTVSARAEFIRIATQMGLNAAAANKLADEYGLVPREVSTDVETPGMNMAQKGAKELRAALLNIPLERRPEIISLFNDKGYKAAMTALNRVKSKTVTITTTHRDVYYVTGGAGSKSTMRATMQADGSILRMFANGGAERHVAQIAPAGAWRLWAEPETGGEAYIPLAASKRARSLDILRETARIFGQRVTPLAIGDVLRPPYASQPHYAAPQPAPVVRSGATITIGTIINPVAEPATISATRELQRVAAAPTGRWV